MKLLLWIAVGCVVAGLAIFIDSGDAVGSGVMAAGIVAAIGARIVQAERHHETLLRAMEYQRVKSVLPPPEGIIQSLPELPDR